MKPITIILAGRFDSARRDLRELLLPKGWVAGDFHGFRNPNADEQVRIATRIEHLAGMDRRTPLYIHPSFSALSAREYNAIYDMAVSRFVLKSFDRFEKLIEESTNETD